MNEEETNNPYVQPTVKAFTPISAKGFTRFILNNYSDLALPPRIGADYNENACSELSFQMTEYQKFVREYLRQESPYRGLLVYHGLGSGKTCASIAAAEAIYGQAEKKIIVMTPISLQDNYINEIMTCGFRHFHLDNMWKSFPLVDDEETMEYMRDILEIPIEYQKLVLRTKDQAKRVYWMPDLTSEENNFQTLEDWERTSIKNQITAIIKHRIEFIGYNGYSHDKMKEILTNDPTHFDNKVIVVDEIHNLTRLISGKLDKYLKPPKAAKPGKKRKVPASYEPITVDKWVPKLQGADTRYDRSFLFYNLFVQAKNTKIIALSGTPIVNFPEEVGILFNILHGYFHTVTDTLLSVDDKVIEGLDLLLRIHPRVDYYELKKGEGQTGVFFSILPNDSVKIYDSGEEGGPRLNGIITAKGTTVGASTIQELYAQIVIICDKKNIPLAKKPIYQAIPLLPPTTEEFRETFVNASTLSILNKNVFVKRVSGLVSYYKGAKEELLPTITKDEVVNCPMSQFALPSYMEARDDERGQEERAKKKSKKGEEVFGELLQLGKGDKVSTSYRFKSRAMCNFVFPKMIKRPFPRTKDDFKEEVVKESEEDEEDVESVAVQREDEEAEDEDQAEDEDKAEAEKAEEERPNVRPYKVRVQEALQKLKEQSQNLFTLDETKPPDQQLVTYSSKYKAILERIGTSQGSSLIYSTFRTMEGIGIFSIVLESAGYAPLTLTGPPNDLRFTEQTERSIRTSPQQPRYIVYSGTEKKIVRQTLIDVFNMKLDKLPTKIAAVLRDPVVAPLLQTKNHKGEVCRVFMITGAGAEGLSLRNVRTVHIMEPYWNKVRTDQVKGRAVRICSHSDLPYSKNPAENQRTVEIFTYLTSFDKTFKIDQTLITKDEGKTSDQHVYQLSEAKEKLSSDFIQSMKEGAVDCDLNKAGNEPIQCYTQELKEGEEFDFLYDPRLRQDIDKTKVDIRTKPAPTVAQPVSVAASASAAAAAAAPKPDSDYKITVLPDGRKIIINIKERLVFRYEDAARLRNPGTRKGVKPVGRLKKTMKKKNGKNVEIDTISFNT